MKKCPFCAEEIQDDAILCRFCGQFLQKKTLVPWYAKPGWLTTAVLCVGPLAIPLFWLNPTFSLRKKLIWTVAILLMTWGLWIAMQKPIESLEKYYGLIDQLDL